MLPIGNRLYCSVLQIHPNWRISPSCIFSAKSCWGVFSPHISHPFSAAWIEAHQPTASVESISPPCTQPQQWGHALWHRKEGRNRERKCRIPHISPPPNAFCTKAKIAKGGCICRTLRGNSYILPWGVVLHIGVGLCLTPMCNIQQISSLLECNSTQVNRLLISVR